MRRTSFLVLFAVFLAFRLDAAPPALYTRPDAPSSEELNHLGLKRRWYAYAPMTGLRDRIISAQVFGDQVVIQTSSGALTALDGETGATAWRIRIGQPFQTFKEYVAANDKTLFVVADGKIYGIDRGTGRQDWSFRLPGILSTAPAVNNELLYLCTKQGGLYAYQLPVADDGKLKKTAAAAAATKDYAKSGSVTPSREEKPSREPVAVWIYSAHVAISPGPVLTNSRVLYADPEGVLHCLNQEKRSELDRYSLDSPVTAVLGIAGDNVFAAAQDSQLYAFEMGFDHIALRWRAVVGGRVDFPAAASENDVYVAGKGIGLLCLDRGSGDRRWLVPNAESFIAAGKRFIFAADPRGQILILDREKGKILGKYDASAFALRLPNGDTDRVYLVNHDGLVVCIHDALQSEPVRHKAPAKKTAPATSEKEKPAEEKPAEEKKE